MLKQRGWRILQPCMMEKAAQKKLDRIVLGNFSRVMKMIGLKRALSVWFLVLVFHRFFQSKHLSVSFSYGEAVCIKSVELEILRWRGVIVRMCQYLSFF